MPSCAVDGCKVRSGRDDKLSLFKFPKERATREAWISFCAKDIYYQFEHAAICEKHFEAKYFTETNLKEIAWNKMQNVPQRWSDSNGADDELEVRLLVSND